MRNRMILDKLRAHGVGLEDFDYYKVEDDEARTIEIPRETYEQLIAVNQSLNEENKRLRKYLENVKMLEGIQMDPSTIKIHEDYDIQNCRRKFVVVFEEKFGWKKG